MILNFILSDKDLNAWIFLSSNTFTCAVIHNFQPDSYLRHFLILWNPSFVFISFPNLRHWIWCPFCYIGLQRSLDIRFSVQSVHIFFFFWNILIFHNLIFSSYLIKYSQRNQLFWKIPEVLFESFQCSIMNWLIWTSYSHWRVQLSLEELHSKSECRPQLQKCMFVLSPLFLGWQVRTVLKREIFW